jgi:hypothetical protein
VLLLLGLAAVITIVSSGRRATSTTTAPPPPVYADAQAPVEVEVRAATQRGELFVNGQSYGPLRADEAVLLRLLPGSYRIEAREADGMQLGQDVLVRPGAATKVVLVRSSD